MNNGYTTTNGGHLASHRHRVARILLSSLLFASSTVLLGLTAQRIHFTRNLIGRSGVVIELLVTSIIAFIASLWLVHALISTAIGFVHKTTELTILFVIWIMSLVGAVILTRDWYPLGPCGSATNECSIQKAIMAFAWIVFGVTSLLLALLLLSWNWDRYDGDVGGKHTGAGRGVRGGNATTTAGPGPTV